MSLARARTRTARSGVKRTNNYFDFYCIFSQFSWSVLKRSRKAPPRRTQNELVLLAQKMDVARSPSPGACNYPIFHGVYTDGSIFSLNLYRIQIPKRTSVINCNPKCGLICWHVDHDVGMFTWGHIVLSLPKRAHVDWNWPISREKCLNIDWSVKMPLHWLIMWAAGS